jgi:hypothetical protein
MTKALQLLEQALDLLDRAQAPPQIGAELDLARDRLSRTLVSVRSSPDPLQPLASSPVRFLAKSTSRHSI